MTVRTLAIAPLPEYEFDSCDEGWTQGGNNSTWRCGVPSSGPMSSVSGNGMLWATNLGGEYWRNEDSQLDSPYIDLSGYQSVRVRIKHWYEFERHGERFPDGGTVMAFDGNSWVQVYPERGYDGVINPFAYTARAHGREGFTARGTQRQWIEDTIDLSGFDNPDFRLRFLFGSDISGQMAGWYIDSVIFESD